MEEASNIDLLWVLFSTALVFLMQAGFGCLEAGSTRAKNSINVVIKNFSDFCFSCVIWWLVGFGLMFGHSKFGIVGTSDFLFSAASHKEIIFFLFQMVFCGTAITIVSGAVAERMQFFAYLCISGVIALLVYPIFGHWVWGGALQGDPGWLGAMGFIDFAGSTVVHSVGGWSALACIIAVGARTGRFKDDGTPVKINGSNIPLSVLGTLLLWFGWIGFNGGSTLAFSEDVAKIVLNTMLAGAAGGVFALIYTWMKEGQAHCEPLFNGGLAGLVAITANCHAVDQVQAIIIGSIGSFVMVQVEALLLRYQLDDVVGAIPVHLGAGAWGTLAVAFFGDPKVLDTGLSMVEQTLVQLVGIGAAGVWTFGVVFGFLKFFDTFIFLRVNRKCEYLGLNMTEHGATTEILDLFRTMNEQRLSGNLKLRAPVEPFTEVGQVAQIYNGVLDTLDRKSQEVQKVNSNLESMVDARTRQIRTILDHVSSGFFIIGRDLTVKEGFTKSCHSLFHIDFAAGTPITEYLDGTEREKDHLNAMIDQVFDDILDPEFTLDQIPSRVTSHGKYLRFEPSEIRSQDGELAGILFTVNDITDLERASQQNEERLSLLRILTNRGAFIRFVDHTRTTLVDLRSIIFKTTEVKAALHTIKGNASLFGMPELVDRIHDLEDQPNFTEGDLGDIEQVLNKFLEQHQSVLGIDINNLQETTLTIDQKHLEELENTFRPIFKDALGAKLSSWIARVKTRTAREMLGPVHDYFQQLTQRLGKQADLRIDGSETPMDPMFFREIFDTIPHLVRNALDHGIEKPAMRKHKDQTGHVRLYFTMDQDSWRIGIEDDGKGINREKLLRKAIELGLINPARAATMTHDEVLQLVAEPRLTTNDQVNLVSGRGLGVATFKNAVEKAGGYLSIRSDENKGTVIEATIPFLKEHYRYSA